ATGTVINTAYIERLNATFRAHLAPLTRRGRAITHTETALTAGMWRGGPAYNFCWPHDSLRQLAPDHAPPKWLPPTPPLAARRAPPYRAPAPPPRKWPLRTPAMAAAPPAPRWPLAALPRPQPPLPRWGPPKRRGRPPKPPPLKAAA